MIISLKIHAIVDIEAYPKNNMLVVQPIAFCTSYKELQARREDSSVEIELNQFEVTTEKTEPEGNDH